MKFTRFLFSSIAASSLLANSLAHAGSFTDEELSVAQFWEDMGPTLTEKGVDEYAVRYHSDFRHWDITGSGKFGSKESAIRFWTKFHADGHRITCTHVEPVTIDIVDDYAFARLVYEQTDTMADGSTTTGVWRMFDVFKRSGGTWQVLESNMIDITPEESVTDSDAYVLTCPAKSD